MQMPTLSAPRFGAATLIQKPGKNTFAFELTQADATSDAAKELAPVSLKKAGTTTISFSFPDEYDADYSKRQGYLSLAFDLPKFVPGDRLEKLHGSQGLSALLNLLKQVKDTTPGPLYSTVLKNMRNHLQYLGWDAKRIIQRAQKQTHKPVLAILAEIREAEIKALRTSFRSLLYPSQQPTEAK